MLGDLTGEHKQQRFTSLALVQFQRGRGETVMKGSHSHELEVEATADEVWGIYGTLELSKLVPKILSNIISKIDVEEGDGGTGTILCVTLNPEFTGSKCYREKFVKVDNEKRVKEALVIQGQYLDLGFTSYLARFEILEKSKDCCMIRSTVEFEIDDKLAAYASHVNADGLGTIAEGVAKHLKEKKDNSVEG